MSYVTPATTAIWLIGLIGCSSSTNRPTDAEARSGLSRNMTPSVAASDQTLLEGANAAFAFDLYASISKGAGNLFFSPYSVSSALSMTYVGARSTTADEMAQTTHFNALNANTVTSQAEAPLAFDWLDLQLASRAQASSANGPGFQTPHRQLALGRLV